MKSIYDNVKFILSLIPQNYGGFNQGNSVDSLGFGSGVLAASVGSFGFGQSYIFTVEESADGSSGWTAIPNTTLTVTDPDTTQVLRLEGLNTGSRKRYLRAVINSSGGSTNCSATFAFGRAFKTPVN